MEHNKYCDIYFCGMYLPEEFEISIFYNLQVIGLLFYRSVIYVQQFLCILVVNNTLYCKCG